MQELERFGEAVLVGQDDCYTCLYGDKHNEHSEQLTRKPRAYRVLEVR